MTPTNARAGSPRVHLACPDLDAALAFYTGELGFRLDMILPADAPRLAELSGHGLTLRLECVPGPGTGDTDKRAGDADVPQIQRASADDAWVTGRAGMQYRDLVPGRLGGRFIASHIRIPGGGPVPDYVHYHRVGFQMIYCRRGWVRVVYEDQGPPFVMQAGDCVLQPPTIRHRVLEASAGLEVVEVGSPAEHETWRDHDLELPTPEVHPERLFDGQHFVRHVARDATWEAMDMSGVLLRDTGIARATHGKAGVRVLHVGGAGVRFPPSRDADGIRFLFVLAGHPQLRCELDASRMLAPDDACLVSAGATLVPGEEGECEVLEVCMPAPGDGATENG